MNVGLITYHSAYNFGSMLQAYATQRIIQQLGHNCSIINYRMLEQRLYYSIFRRKYGLRKGISDLLMTPKYGERVRASERFEDFIRSMLVTTNECIDPIDAINQMSEFDCMISGSDQIWNKHSYELENIDWAYMLPYLLVGYNGKRISYASSTGGMTVDELEKIARYINEFDSISAREEYSREILSSLTGRNVSRVVDPTFLLNSEMWLSQLGIRERDCVPYVLYYSLSGYSDNIKRLNVLGEFAKKHGCKLKILSPRMYLPVHPPYYDFVYDYGPMEFLDAVFNASIVVSESYHGTILAINFNKEIYALCSNKKADYRKVEVLERLGIPDRIIGNINQLLDMHSELDFNDINVRIQQYRKDSIEYLNEALKA